MTAALVALSILALALVYAGWRWRRAGRIEAERDALETAVEIKDAQAKAAVDAPRSKRDLVDELRRNGGF